ncbi:MAG TPA: sialidase family protein, partial [Candidatus Limnocylindrales bacterium]
ATFADPDVGWLATLDSTDPRSPVFDVWRTTDGGRTWTKAVLPEGANRSDTMGAADFSVVGTGHVLLWIEGGMPNGWTSDLYESTDAGATWSGPRTSSPGVSGLATFADGTHGVVAGGASGHDLIRTSDGGTTWESVRYPLPAGATRKLTTFPTPARFWDARHGAIAAIYSTPDLIPMLVILTTADAGATWTVAATHVDQGRVAFLDAEDWVEVTGASVGLSADGGTTWSTWAMPSLPGAISDLSMPDVRNGWAVVRDFGCHSGCEVSLVATTDGWHTAAALTPGAPGARPLASGTPEPTASTQVGLDVSALAFSDGRNGLAGGEAPTGGDSGANAAEGRIERTSDGGRTWDVTSYSGSPVLALAAADGLAWAATGCLDAPARRASSRARTAAGPGRPPHGIS